MTQACKLSLKVLVAATVLGVATGAAAIDEYDAGVNKDNTATSTRNELQRGVTQYHDLEGTDEDWFVLPVLSYKTYQVTVSEISADTPINNADFLELWNFDGTTKIDTATAGANATSKSIRFSSGNNTSFRVRVKGSAGTPAASRYGITYYESTMYCARYNQSGTQVSVLIVTNVTNSSCNVWVDFFNEAGDYLGGTLPGPGGTPPVPPNAVPANGTLVYPASIFAGINGTKGNARIHNLNCSPSAFKAKFVALEPSSGFSFDTLCERR